MKTTTLLIAAASLAGALHAQSGSIGPVITESKAAYTGVKNNLIKAAEKMPDDAYSFKQTDGQETFAQRIAHISNQIGTCSALTGERKRSEAAGKTAKADLVAALKASFDACDAAWDAMNDKTALETTAGRGGQVTKLGTLIRNTNHDSDMYGYISNYMRLKGVTPPSSEGR